MSDWQMGEKSEKEHEKEQEKEQEKSWEEKHRRDPLSTLVWGAILVWAGVVLLLDQLGIDVFGQLGGWSLILAGVGVILLLEVGARLLIASYRRPVSGTAILGVVLISVGLGLAWELVFPALLIGFGLVILVRTVLRRP
ncbi:MAG: hypothetical protein E3J64_08620 [Anaerolineales bacterium]|nr:MAG: hypothetical protein E3J64_08620 [Anaerolineales bacterium]